MGDFVPSAALLHTTAQRFVAGILREGLGILPFALEMFRLIHSQ